MDKMKDHTGQKIGALQILERLLIDVPEHGKARYRVRCDCGVEKLIRPQQVSKYLLHGKRKGHTLSCGCLRGSGNLSTGLEGKRFDLLTVVKHVRGGWLVRCDCGTEFITDITNATRKNATVPRSCGCASTHELRGKAVSVGVAQQVAEYAESMIGERHRYLEIIKRIGKGESGEPIWLIQCDCGNTTELPTWRFRKNVSCGCYVAEVAKKRRIPAHLKKKPKPWKERWAGYTQEQKDVDNARHRVSGQKRRDAMTGEEKAALHKAQRVIRANRSPESKAQYKARQREKYANFTQEQKDVATAKRHKYYADNPEANERKHAVSKEWADAHTEYRAKQKKIYREHPDVQARELEYRNEYYERTNVNLEGDTYVRQLLPKGLRYHPEALKLKRVQLQIRRYIKGTLK